jgi:Uma2 family endonuclease
MRIYAQHGVSYAWLVDPMMKTLEVFALEAGKWVVLDVYADNDKVRARPFQELEFDLRHLWTD